MTDKRKPTEIADTDLDIRGGEGGPGAIDAFRFPPVPAKDGVALNPSRTYKDLGGKDDVLLNPSRTYKDVSTKG